METLIQTTPAYPNLRHVNVTRFAKSSTFSLASVYTSPVPSICLKLRKSVIVGAKKNHKNKKDKQGFILEPDETTGFYPEAVLLKEKKVREDGKLLPEFADTEEEKLYEYLNLEMESQLKVERMRHYEVVYLIHEKHAEEVGSVNEKIQDFLREKKGRIWRLNDWGMRRLAYKIQKATHAHYMLLNFEIEAKWINEFKSMLDKDERVIRHLVIKRDEAITEDCPPPPEYHTLRAGMDDGEEEDDDLEYDDDDDDEAYDEDWDGEGEMEGYEDGTEDGIIIVNSDENDDDDSMDWNNQSDLASDKGKRNRVHEKVGR